MNISRNKIYVPEGGSKTKRKSLALANMMVAELANYGYVVDDKIHQSISTLKPKKAKKIVSSILGEYTVGDLNSPLFPGWEDRDYFSFGEFVVQIFGYIFQFSGNDLYDPNFLAALKREVEFSKFKRLSLASDEEFKDYFVALTGASVTLDRKTSQKIKKIFKIFSEEVVKLPRIKSAEIRIGALLALSEEVDLGEALTLLKCEPVDALRFAAAKNDFELFKLPHDVIYASLTWAERVSLFGFLDKFSFEEIGEAMGLNRGAWVRFLKHTHFFGQKKFINRFRNFYRAAFVSVGNRLENADKRLGIHALIKSGLVEVTESGALVYRTFASRIMSAVEEKNCFKIKELCDKRPGYLFRNFSTILNGIQKKDEGEFVSFVREKIPNVPVGVLFSILEIEVNAKYRVIDIKGNTVIETASYPRFISDIQGDIRRYIKGKYGFSGKVNVSEELRNSVVPFLAKNTELPRGSRMSFDGSKYLYFFVHWVQKNRRTDLDHSFQIFDANWNVETVYFGRQANDFISQSGDITNAPAPNGATEYGKIDLSKIPEKVKYIVPSINVYCGEQFSDTKEARAGFLFSNNSQFTLNDQVIQYSLSQPAQYNIPFILDVENQEVIVIDFNNRERYGWTAHSYASDLPKIIDAVKTKRNITIGDLGKMLSGDEDETSVTFSCKKGEKSIDPDQLFSIFN